MVWGKNRAFWVGSTEKMHTGAKGQTHMDTGITDTDRLGKRKSDNWPPGLTTQRSSFISAKD